MLPCRAVSRAGARACPRVAPGAAASSLVPGSRACPQERASRLLGSPAGRPTGRVAAASPRRARRRSGRPGADAGAGRRPGQLAAAGTPGPSGHLAVYCAAAPGLLRLVRRGEACTAARWPEHDSPRGFWGTLRGIAAGEVDQKAGAGRRGEAARPRLAGTMSRRYLAPARRQGPLPGFKGSLLVS